MPSHRPSLLALALLLGLAGCSQPESACPPTAHCPAAMQISMDFTAHGDFYAAPFPTDARPASAALDDFPNPDKNDLARRILAILKQDSGGYSLTAGIYFRLSAAPPTDLNLPTVLTSVDPASSVMLIGIDPASPDYLQRIPLSAKLLADGGPYGAPQLLALLPLQGAPLRPKTRYAAVVMNSLAPTLTPSATMATLAAGGRPTGLGDSGFATYQAALQALAAAKIDVKKVAALAAFTTGDPLSAMGRVVAAMNAAPPAPAAPFVPQEVFPTYCVYSTTIPMPEYQQGQAPYTYDGGDWAFDAAGEPVLQRMEPARFVVTIPRQPMPPAGYPVVVLSRTGAGGDRPLVDRGVQGMTGGPALVPGTGPALYYAAAGFAGSSIDGPLGGLRATTSANEDFTIFNVGNPAALRDNVRQSAAELALQAHILEKVTIDVSACPGAVAPASVAHLDTKNKNLVLMGHSMGATIAPLALAFEPSYKAGLLSGAGGSMIENVIYKQKPIPVLGIAETLVGVTGTGYGLTEHDPLLSLFQWACEPSDPPVYSRRITLSPEDGPPRHILMMQGIVDHYIMPPIADAESLSLGLDLGGPELDITAPEIATLAPVNALLPLLGRGQIALPAGANLAAEGGGKVTAVFTQNQEDGIEDGHEIAFQTEGPKHQYICFLKGLLKGMPTVPSAGKAMDPCP